MLATIGAVGSTGTGGDGNGGGPGDINTGGPIGPTGSTGVPADVATSIRGLVPEGPDYDVSSISFRVAEYSFLQLSAWREQLLPAIWSSSDVTGLDLDEVRNGLTVYLKTGVGEDAVRAIAQQAAIPSAALHFEVVGEVVDANTLKQRSRPVQGAFQMFYGNYPNGATGGPACTIGFNAIMNAADTVFITNSHCTKKKFGLDSGTTYAYQGGISSTHIIGNEFVDPPPEGYFLNLLGVRIGPKRTSDAAAYKYTVPPADRAVGRIARTDRKHFRNSSIPNVSLTVDRANPYFEIVGEIAWPTATSGRYYNKIGARTGWTYGGIKATCATLTHSTCSYKINARTNEGDSGAPVFYWRGGSTNDVYLSGMIWGKDDNFKGLFNPMGAIEDDLGSLKTY